MCVGKVQGRFGLAKLGLCLALLGAASNGSAAGETSDHLNVVVTIKPVHSLVAQVMEGLGQPSLLIDGRASPHAFSLRPSDAKALSDADVVVRVGPAVEPFTVRLSQTLSSATRLVTLQDAAGVKLLETRRGSRFEAHDHGDAHEREDQPAHEHEHEQAKRDGGHDEGDKVAHEHGQDHREDAHGRESDESHDHDHDHDEGGIDGHIWLDPDNAKAIVRQIADVLGALRPNLKDKLAANATKAIAGIDALDAQIRADIAPITGKRFIVFHDAYQYFERHYGLQAAGAITLNPEVKPSARRLSEIRQTLAETSAGCVFAEPQFSPRIVASVIEGTNAKAGTIDPLGADIPAGTGQYSALMRAIAKDLVGCLGAPAAP